VDDGNEAEEVKEEMKEQLENKPESLICPKCAS